MQGRLTLLLFVSLSFLLAGCPAPQGRVVYAPIVEKPADANWPFALPAAEPEPKEPKKGGQMLLIYARIMAAHPADLTRAGIAPDKPLSILPSLEALKTLDTLLRERKAQLLWAPRIVAAPGQNATISVTKAYNYVGDYAPKTGREPGAEPWAPVLRTVNYGFVLTVRADVADDKIAFAAVDHRMANAFGVRECKSKMGAAGKEGMAVDWEEPIILISAGALPAGEKVALRPGASLVLFLSDSVRIVTSDVRKRLDQPVQARTPRALRAIEKPDPRGFPLPGRTFILLTARAVESPDGSSGPQPQPKPAP
ncbi:MAG: hypothetical protein FJ291_04485 [Planctomycetes bacterium]|nr:hypothetical protein [Planctomycetota bacterium]